MNVIKAEVVNEMSRIEKKNWVRADYWKQEEIWPDFRKKGYGRDWQRFCDTKDDLVKDSIRYTTLREILAEIEFNEAYEAWLVLREHLAGREA